MIKLEKGQIQKSSLAGLIIGLFAAASSSTLMADDIDIYLSNNIANTKPNILFIFDSSGSMNGTVTSQVPFDPDTDYSGSYNNATIYVEVNNNIVANMAQSIVRCDKISGRLEEFGVYTDNVAWWNSDATAWSPFSKLMDNQTITTHIECRADSGSHGETTGNSKVYAVHGALGPWSEQDLNEIRWKGMPPVNLFTGNFLNWRELNQTENRKKIEIVRDVAYRMASTISDVNIGIMSFAHQEGGKVDVALDDVDVNREILKSSINAYSASGWTPLSETLFEAKRYLAGEAVKFGGSGDSNARRASDNSRYQSPITSACQKTNIVLLSDGQPTRDKNHNAEMISELGLGTCSSHNNICLDEIAKYLGTKDIMPDSTTGLGGIQSAKVYTIGFNIDLPILRDTAEVSGAKYYTANDSLELERSLNEIAQDALATSSTFTAPSLSVNQLDSAVHENHIYFAMFQPEVTEQWSGNLKKYQLNMSTGNIEDQNDNEAVDPLTGLFKNSASSFWNSTVDGNDVKKGGAAEALDASRNLFTYTGSSEPDDVSLNTSSHKLNLTNTLLTTTLLGATDATELAKIIQWVNGVDVLDNDDDGNITEANHYLSDPLHSQPVVISYGEGAHKKGTVFYGDNLGVLHAIDAESGEEIFGFIPQALLPNLRKYYADDAYLQKVYGMDGAISLWMNDKNGNGKILTDTGAVESGEHIYLYAGMRRGGNQYFALDVTDRESPKLKWRITGGQGDFASLGQTWSAPQLATVPWECVDVSGATNCAYKKVLFFSGGYDPAQDIATLDSDGKIPADSVGNVIYMVDAESGELLWSAGNGTTHDVNIAQMDNSIPSNLTLGDLNNNGLIDTIFYVDIIGKVFRIDINESSSSVSNFAKGAMIADFSNSDSSSGHFARFYNRPDVSFFNRAESGTFLTIALGSGSRANPMHTFIENKFYMFKDPYVFTKPASTADYGYDDLGNTIDLSDLYDATSNKIQTGSDAEKSAAKAALKEKRGWYITLDSGGEKVLSSSITLKGNLKFTTYNPSRTSSSNSCVAVGSGKAYIVNILDATGSIFKDSSGNFVRSMELNYPGIPPSPTVVFLGEAGHGATQTSTFFGATHFGISTESTIEKIYWRSDD